MVSIIIPLYNVENYVIDSLKSAFAQTYSDIEFLLVDDCSTDHTMQIVEEYVLNHPRREAVRIIHHDKNLGLSAARNTGLEQAYGEYIFFMDSDDEITEDCIENLYQAISGSGADWVMGNIELQGVFSQHIKKIYERQIVGGEILSSYLKQEWLEAAWNKLLRRTFLIENELTFVSGLLHEDVLWAYHLAKGSKKVKFIRNKGYIYKVREGSITSTKVKKRVESFVLILSKLYPEYSVTPFKKEFSAFFSSLQFVASLLIISSAVSNMEKKVLYDSINAWTMPRVGLKSRLLRLPFGAFQFLLALPYKMYKKLR